MKIHYDHKQLNIKTIITLFNIYKLQTQLRKHKDEQRVYEKVDNTIYYQEFATQIHNDISPHTW